MSERINLLTPVGRLVGGYLYEPKIRTNNDGTPKLGKDGKPMTEFWIPIAIPKGAETHWSQTPWGKLIWDCGVSAFGQIASSARFAFKVTDGDSTMPNSKGKAPNTLEGYKGHWVLNFSGSISPKFVNHNGSAYLLDKDAIKPGNWIQIAGSVSDNKPAETPGVYLNYSLVSLQGEHPEGLLEFGPDPTTVGFGQAPLPSGVRGAPPVGMAPAAVAPAAVAPAAAPAPVAPAVGVAPNPAFLQPPPQPPAPPAPPAPAGPVMTAKAAGVTYEAMRAAGWTDALLREHGYVV